MERKISQNQILIKICCVIASFILWLYVFNVENPVRQRKIVVPVNIVNKEALSQSKLVEIDDKNLEIPIEIKGNASDIFSIKAEDFKLECDLGSYVMKKGENKVPVEVKKSPGNVTIVNNENLWLSIKLDTLAKKNLPIKVLIDGQTKNGLRAVNSVLKTKNADIYGAASSVYSVNRIIASYNIRNISRDTSVSVALQAEDSYGNIVKDVYIKPQYVEVNISLKNVKSVPVNIKTTGNIQGGAAIKSIFASPGKIDIAGDYRIISNINSLDTEPVDLSKISSSGGINAKLIVPDKVYLLNNSGYVTLNINLINDDNKISQRTINSKIQTKNLDGNYTAEVENSSISIIVSGKSNIINNLNENDVQCFVDLSSISQGENNVSVNVNLPDGVSLVSKNPQNVKVKINKKTSEVSNVN